MSCAADPEGGRQDAWSKVGHRRGIKIEKPLLVSGAAFFIFVFGVEVLLHGKPCDKNVWNVFELRGVCADPKGGRQDAWNKVGHRRGIIKSERPPVFGWPFCFWVSAMRYFCMVQHVTNSPGAILSSGGLRRLGARKAGCLEYCKSPAGY